MTQQQKIKRALSLINNVRAALAKMPGPANYKAITALATAQANLGAAIPALEDFELQSLSAKPVLPSLAAYPLSTGRDPGRRRTYVDILFMGLKGGSGAMADCDGYDHIGMIDAPGGVLDQDYEMFEQQTPHVLIRHEYLPDSAGAGQWRGGLGVETVFRIGSADTELVTFGDGDFEKTMEISIRCGQDSDCNPSSAAGVLGVMLGFDRIPAKFKADLPKFENTKFDYTDYSFNDIVKSIRNWISVYGYPYFKVLVCSYRQVSYTRKDNFIRAGRLAVDTRVIYGGIVRESRATSPSTSSATD